MTEQQKNWLTENPTFSPIGPPRSVQFSQWGTLYADGTYERLDNKPGQPIRVGNGAIGVGVIKQGAEQ